MNLYVNWRSAFKAIANNRKRSILTMLGIVIGIAAVIAILAIGRGYERDLIKSLTKSDNGQVEVQIIFNPNDPAFYDTNRPSFQSSDLSLIRQVKGVKSADFEAIDLKQATLSTPLKGEEKNVSVDLVKKTDQNLIAGRNLSVVDNLNFNKTALINRSLATDLYHSPQAALNRGISLGSQVFTIVGVYEDEAISEDEMGMAGMFGSDTNYQAKIPKKTYSRYYQGSKNTASVTAVLDKGTKPDEVANKILDKLKKQGSLRNQGTYQSFDSSFLTKGIGKVLSTITYFISAVAGIALFIAGVGVMNMMYISVSERTKEIGIRRALGATQRSIMIQFLLEGIMLTFTGGIIGYLLGMVVAYSIGAIMKIGIQIDFFTISIAVGVSTLIGLVFSVMPAREAAKKDLIDILR